MTFKVYIAVAGIALSSLVSCGGSDNADYVDKSLITPGSEKKDTIPTVVTGNNNIIPASVPPSIPGVTPVMPGVPVSLAPQQNTMQVSPATPVATTTAPGMNPPHGEPGHRCDIQVGAPLNSKPEPANTQPATINAQPTTVSTQPQQVTMTPAPNTQKTAPGMNPPHGEPGHRCEIAVGAPLDSQPTTPPATQTSVPPLSITPAKPDSSKN